MISTTLSSQFMIPLTWVNVFWNIFIMDNFKIIFIAGDRIVLGENEEEKSPIIHVSRSWFEKKWHVMFVIETWISREALNWRFEQRKACSHGCQGNWKVPIAEWWSCRRNSEEDSFLVVQLASEVNYWFLWFTCEDGSFLSGDLRAY